MNTNDGQKQNQTENNQGKIESRKLHNLPVSDNESTPSSGEEPANDRPSDIPIAKAGTTLRRFALETSVLVTILWIVGSVISLVSMFSGTDIGPKAFTAVVSGFFAWWSIRLLWDYYRSKDEGKRHQALELLNFWGFLWIGVGLGSFALGAGFAILVPIFKSFSMATLSYKVGAVVGVIVVGYWIVSAIFKNKR